MPETKRDTAQQIAVALVIGAVVAYHIYFFSFDLPNAPMPGDPNRHYSRLIIWQLSVPGYVAEGKCLFVQAIERIADIACLPQRIAILAYSGLIALAATGVGAGALRGLSLCDTTKARRELQAEPAESSADGRLTFVERLVLAFGLGMSALSLAMLGMGLAGWMNRPIVVAFMIAIVAASGIFFWRDRGRANGGGRVTPENPIDRRSPKPKPGGWRRLAFVGGGLGVGLFMTISLLGAMLPASDFDVREYHLQGPKEFYVAGRITFLPHNVYANMPFGTEMLSLLAMVVAGDWWWGALVGQTVLATFGPMTALAVWSLARRLFGPDAGWLAGLIYLTTPWVYRISIIPYTENALCFYLLAGTLAAVLACGGESARVSVTLWLLTGALAGSAAACKYPALVSTVLPLALVAALSSLVRRRFDAAPSANERRSLARSTLRALFAVAVGTALTIGPWIAKNCAMTGNPVFPLLYGVFGGRNWTPEKNEKWEWGHRVPLLVALGVPRPPEGKTVHPFDPQTALTLRRLRENAIDVAAKADWQSPLTFGLAPLAVFARRGRRAAAWLWLFVAYLFFQWWLLTHRLDRFWVPLLPVAAVLAGAGATWSDHAWWRRFCAFVVALCTFYNFSFATTGLCGNNNYAARLDPARRDPSDELVNELNDTLPATAKLLAVGAADLFHLDRPLLYNTVFDDSIFARLVRGRSPREAAAAFAESGVTHVYVNWLEVARYREPWSYGFPEFVTPAAFEPLLAAGVLRRVPLPPGLAGPPVSIGPDEAMGRELFEIVQDGGSP